MGQKVNPHGLRVGVIKNWDSRWFVSDEKFGDTLVSDYNIRKYLKKELQSAGVPKIEIERDSQRVRVFIHCAKPGMVIGKGGVKKEELKAKLEKYRSMFCYVENGKMHKRAILLFISGKRPMKTILEQGDGYMFLDGTISELGSNIDSNMMPVVSDNFTKFVKWNGEAEISQSELEKMRGYIAKTHAEGKLFRWWGAPDKAQFKKLFIEEGVDLIGADDLDILIDVIQDVK